MSKSSIGSIVIVVVILAIVIAGGGFLLANSKNSDSDTKTDTSTGSSMKMSADSSSSSSSSNATETTSVTIENFAFSPANISVKVGDTVTWTNKDSTTHTITETDGQNGPKSTNIEPGKSFVFTYDTAGTYKYDCSIHPSMIGSVTVTAR